MVIPKIRIQSSALLFNSVSDSERQQWADGTGQSMMSFAEVEEYTLHLRAAWMKYEREILQAMVGLYGVEFKKAIIDIYVSPWNKSISNPLIINPSRPPEVQTDTVSHELLHVLFTDNSAFSMHDDSKGVKLADEWRQLFGGDHDWKTLVHIPVHAGLKAIFVDVLHQPERLDRDILRHQSNPAYKRAWEYVEEYGYAQINDQLSDLYKGLASPAKESA
jgi:hypothetical protein